jgi:uncharacterized membrane protein
MKVAAFIKREAINIILILMPFIYLFAVYEDLPPFKPFPLNWDQGIYYLLIFTMGVSVIFYLVLLIRPLMVPKTALHQHMKSLHRIKTLMLCLTSLLSLTYISEKIGLDFNWARIGLIISMGFIIAIGNIYPTLRFNYFIGIRNAWTTSNELIWNKTHRFAGKLAFGGGLIGALYAIFFNPFPVPYMPVIYVGYVFLLTFIPRIYAFVMFRRSQLNP